MTACFLRRCARIETRLATVQRAVPTGYFFKGPLIDIDTVGDVVRRRATGNAVVVAVFRSADR